MSFQRKEPVFHTDSPCWLEWSSWVRPARRPSEEEGGAGAGRGGVLILREPPLSGLPCLPPELLCGKETIAQTIFFLFAHLKILFIYKRSRMNTEPSFSGSPVNNLWPNSVHSLPLLLRQIPGISFVCEYFSTSIYKAKAFKTQYRDHIYIFITITP